MLCSNALCQWLRLHSHKLKSKEGIIFIDFCLRLWQCETFPIDRQTVTATKGLAVLNARLIGKLLISANQDVMVA